MQVVQYSHHVQSAGVSVLCAITAFHSHHPALFHALLYGQVQYSFLFAVVNSGNTAVVALSVIGLYVLHHLCGDVLHGQFGVVSEELLAVYHNPLDGLAVVRDGAVLCHLHARQFLY